MICGGFKEVLGGFVASRGAEQDYDLSLLGVACLELDPAQREGMFSRQLETLYVAQRVGISLRASLKFVVIP